MIFIPITIIALLTGLFFLADDWRDWAKFVKEDWKLFGLALIPAVIYIGYPIYIIVGVYNLGVENTLWNPYVFGGMPSYAIATGYPWFNFMYVIVTTTRMIIFDNPIGALLFAGSVYLVLKRYNKLTYSLMIFTEVTMLYFGFWRYGK